MNKQKGSLGAVVAVVGGVLAIILLIGFSKSPNSVGGNFNPANQDAYSFSVEGTEVISHAKALTATALTVSGATTLTGATSIGSITAGLNFYRPVLAPSADTTLTIAQTGSIVQMAVAGLDVTLPAPTAAAGVGYRFVVSAAVATTDMTIVAGTADTIEGTLIVAGAVVDCDASDLLTFVIDGENIGDYVDMYSDGTKWLIGDSGALTASKLTCSG